MYMITRVLSFICCSPNARASGSEAFIQLFTFLFECRFFFGYPFRTVVARKFKVSIADSKADLVVKADRVVFRLFFFWLGDRANCLIEEFQHRRRVDVSMAGRGGCRLSESVTHPGNIIGPGDRFIRSIEQFLIHLEELPKDRLGRLDIHGFAFDEGADAPPALIMTERRCGQMWHIRAWKR